MFGNDLKNLSRILYRVQKSNNIYGVLLKKTIVLLGISVSPLILQNMMKVLDFDRITEHWLGDFGDLQFVLIPVRNILIILNKNPYFPPHILKAH